MANKLQKMLEKPMFMQVIMYLIVINSIILGLKAYPGIMNEYGFFLDVIDDVMIAIFACELLLYLFVFGSKRCFSDPWYLFDFCVIAITLIPLVAHILSYFLNITEIPNLGHFSALRAIRVLRILRLISIFPSLRKVIEGLITSIPGIASIGAILMIMLYVSSLIAVNMFGHDFPEWFGSIQASLFTLFQVMTSENWPEIARSVMEVYPYSWVFFILYMLVATFVILNLFIGVIVDAMSKEEVETNEAVNIDYFQEITEKLDLLEKKLDQLTRPK
jgi:voltage-gated sodium channel